MKFATISDVHIKNPDDCINHVLFLKFLNSKYVSDSDKIFLLGDIFDIMVGNHKEYLNHYGKIFQKLSDLGKENKEIYYIEGNHDFHIVSLLNSFAKKENIPKFIALEKAMLIVDNETGKRIYLGHGDEIELENPSYRAYSSFVRSFVVRFIAHYIFTFNFIIKLGKWAAQKSRNRNEKKYDVSFNDEGIKARFRRSVEKAHGEYKFDYIICGHSHVRDQYKSINNFEYLNNGYFPIEKSFIFYENGKAEIVALT